MQQYTRWVLQMLASLGTLAAAQALSEADDGSGEYSARKMTALLTTLLELYR